MDINKKEVEIDVAGLEGIISIHDEEIKNIINKDKEKRSA